MKKTTKNENVEDSHTEYERKSLKVFNSFEDENVASAKIMSERSPLENFRIAHEMIKAMYAKELAQLSDASFKRITFTVINGRPV